MSHPDEESCSMSVVRSARVWEEEQPKPRCTIPTMSLIAITALLSTMASVAGGLVMYFQGLEALEDTVADSSASECASMHNTLANLVHRVPDAARVLKQTLYSNERINSNNSEEWASLVRSIAFAQVAGSDTLYESGVLLLPYNVSDRSVMYSSVWGDVLKNGSKQLVHGGHGDYLPDEYHTINPDGSLVVSVPSHSLHPDTGYMDKLLYSWNLKGYLEVRPAWRNTTFEGNRASWDPPYTWRASDGNYYGYVEMVTVIPPPVPPHPWSSYESVSVIVGFLMDVLQDPFVDFRAEHHDTLLMIVDRELALAGAPGDVPPERRNVVIASTEKGLTATCKPDDCRMTVITDLSSAMQEGYWHSASMPFGSFSRATLGGKDYYIRRQLSIWNFELVWMRPASSVDGKVQEALMYLVIFTVTVLVFDLVISIAEVMFIALPMKRLSVAIRSVADMKTEEAAEALKALGASPLREVGVMRAATTLLVENVSEYKTFLPQALLETDEAQVAVHQRDAPGTDGTAAIVFTDIRGSTQLWEACHSGMSVGLRLHNEVVRRCIAEHNGYEVKTIGDAFMVAFDTADEAVLFGLAVQDQLTKAAWPEDLLCEPLCVRDDSGDWVGIRVRIGVTYGPVTAEVNAVSKRCDYFGPTVNRAARLESVCVGGAVAVEDSLARTFDPHTSSKAVVIRLGQCVLKGLSEQLSVSQLVPKTLPRRVQFFMQNSPEVLPRNPEDSQSSLGSDDSSVRRRPLPFPGMALDRPAILTTTGQVTLESGLDDATKSPMLQLNHLVMSTMAALERTDGSLLTVAGGAAVVGWNIPKPCASHVESAFRFAGMMVRALGDNVRCGLSTGPMHSGYVGSQGQRFMTAVGLSSINAAATLYSTETIRTQLAYTSTVAKTVALLCNSGYLTFRGTRLISQREIAVHEMNRKKVEEWCDDKVSHSLLPRESGDAPVVFFGADSM